jgi:hypothetical protein
MAKQTKEKGFETASKECPSMGGMQKAGHSTGCCPKKNSFERSLKRFLLINLGESHWSGTGASFRFIKKRFRPSEKGFGQQPVNKLSIHK